MVKSESLAVALSAVGMVQAVFLPGLVITMRLRGWNLFQRVIYSIPLSVVLNHFLVWLLVLLGVYGPLTVGGVIVLEGLLLLLLRRPSAPLAYPAPDRPAELIFLVVAMLQVTKYFEAWGRFFGDPFLMGDAIANWNGWAKDWLANRLYAFHMYPPATSQLFSLTYVLSGRTDIETFAKAGSALLFLGALLALLELGFRKKGSRTTAWAAIAVYATIQARFLQSHWASGYLDVPLSAMTVFAFALASLELPGAVAIYGAVAGGAGVVKQPGILFAGLSPWLARGWTDWRELLRRAVYGALVSVPWTAFAVYSIYVAKTEENNVEGLTSMVGGGLLGHWAFTMRLVIGYGGAGFLLFWLFLAFLGCYASRDARRWFLGFGLPWFLIWGSLFGYDIRNISAALFPFGLAGAAGVAFLADGAERWLLARIPGIARNLPARMAAVSPTRIVRVCIALASLSALIGFKKPIGHWREYGSLLGWEQEQKRNLGDYPQANKALFALLPCLEKTGAKLLANYQWVVWLPGLEKHSVTEPCKDLLADQKAHAHAYAFFDTAACPAEVNAELAKEPSIYSDGKTYLMALDPSLPRTCSQSAGAVQR